MNHTITKLMGSYPAAHRQPKHQGHCRLIHGHNWSFEFRVEADELDKQGFVFDFGHFKPVKDYLAKTFDHTLLLQADDPHLEQLVDALDDQFATIHVVESVSCEGRAKMLHEKFEAFFSTASQGRARLASVSVHEDEKNSCTYAP